MCDDEGSGEGGSTAFSWYVILVGELLLIFLLEFVHVDLLQ